MTTYLGSAFSPGMVLHLLDRPGDRLDLRIERVDPVDVPRDAISIVGHQDTACLMGRALGRDITVNRVSVRLARGDVLYWAQYDGPRVPEGATKLPQGASLVFLRLEL